MKRLATIAAFLLTLVPAVIAQSPKLAASQADPMAWAYGNTLEISVPTVFFKMKRYIDRDGTWRDVASYGGGAGKWELKGSESCFTQLEPEPEEGYRHLCSPAVPRVVGDVWFASDAVTGNLLRMEVIAGRD